MALTPAPWQLFFSTSLSTRFPPVRPFLHLISAPTGFYDWGLVTRWAQLLITSNYNLQSTLKDQSTMREKQLRKKFVGN